MAGVLQARSRGRQLAPGRNLRAGNDSAPALVRVILEKYPVSALVRQKKRVGPEMSRRRINPMKAGEVALAFRMQQRLAVEADRDAPVLHSFSSKAGRNCTLQSERRKPEEHVAVAGGFVDLSLALVGRRGKRILLKVIPSTAMQFVELSNEQVGRTPICGLPVLRYSQRSLGGKH